MYSIVGTYIESFAFYYGLEFVVIRLMVLYLASCSLYSSVVIVVHSHVKEADKSEIGVKIYLKKK